MIGATAINHVILMGRLTKIPEIRTTQNGFSNTNFTIAISRAFENQNGERETDFINCVAWRQTAEFICRNFNKGQLIIVEGDLRTRSYDDKNYPDIKHYVTEVFVNTVGFGETKASAEAAKSGNSTQNVNNSADINSYTNTVDNTVQSVNAVGDIDDFTEIISQTDLPF